MLKAVKTDTMQIHNTKLEIKYIKPAKQWEKNMYKPA